MDSLGDLLGSTSTDTFFDTCYQRTWLHVPGALTAAAGLDESVMLRALNSARALAGRILFHGNRPADGEALNRYLAEGRPIIWESALGASAEVDALTSLLARELKALVWPNVYWTGEAGATLSMHFDPHDVWAVQCAGEKLWRISSLQVNTPLDREETRALNAQAVHEGAEIAARRIEAEIVTRPGDLLYLPRGRFHLAHAASGRSIHVTFGACPASGVNLTDALANLALREPTMRQLAPGPAQDPSGDAAHHWLTSLRERLHELLDSDEFTAEFSRLQREFVDRSSKTQ